LILEYARLQRCWINLREWWRAVTPIRGKYEEEEVLGA